MVSRAIRNKCLSEALKHVAKARALARKNDIDVASPIGDFIPGETMESEFDRLLNKLS